MSLAKYVGPVPVVGRIDTGLSPIRLEIIHGGGMVVLDPNTALMAADSESLELGDCVGPSVLSGEPGYLYRSSEMQLILTQDELYRFLRHDLFPSEFLKLLHAYGTFFEIHDDFYDERTGIALQPLKPLTTVMPDVNGRVTPRASASSKTKPRRSSKKS